MPRLLVLLALLGACASPAPTSGPTASPFEVEAPPVWSADGIRIATFNGEFLFDGEGKEGEATFAWKGEPAAARAHRDAVAAVVRTLDADLVLIPETEHLATLQRMADESLADLGYDAVLVDGLDSFTGQDVGLLSRFPVEAEGRTNERATVGVSDARYGVSKNLWARLTLPDGTPITVIGVHFLARPDDVERRDRREAQAEVIRQLVQQEIEAGRQVIALGDFNDLDDQVQDRGGYLPITDVLATVKRDGIERQGGSWSAEEEAAFKQPTLDMFAEQSHPLYASARLWDDGVIDPRKTRDILALSLSASLNAPIAPTRFGVFRM